LGGFGFLIHHAGRGLELESVAATPWYLRQAITGRAVNWASAETGSPVIVSPTAELVAKFLMIVMLILSVALVVWWVAWQRRGILRTAATGRDAVFTAVLLYVVVSEVLSPQYLIWLVGVGAVALGSPTCRVRRPIGAVMVAVLLTGFLLLGPWTDLISNGATGAYLLTFRNAVLLIGAVDAALMMLPLAATQRLAGE
jgi:hypothetical protein